MICSRDIVFPAVSFVKWERIFLLNHLLFWMTHKTAKVPLHICTILYIQLLSLNRFYFFVLSSLKQENHEWFFAFAFGKKFIQVILSNPWSNYYNHMLFNRKLNDKHLNYHNPFRLNPFFLVKVPSCIPDSNCSNDCK